VEKKLRGLAHARARKGEGQDAELVWEKMGRRRQYALGGEGGAE